MIFMYFLKTSFTGSLACARYWKDHGLCQVLEGPRRGKAKVAFEELIDQLDNNRIPENWRTPMSWAGRFGSSSSLTSLSFIFLKCEIPTLPAAALGAALLNKLVRTQTHNCAW